MNGLTSQFYQFTSENDWDLVGIASVEELNRIERPGRRPADLWPYAKAVIVLGVGLADPFTRGWVKNGKQGKFYSHALLTLDQRVWMLRRYFRLKGYHTFGGESYGGGIFDTSLSFRDAAASCGLGYIGKSNALITEKYGPRINLTCMATDAPLVSTVNYIKSRCGKCRSCEKHCLSGAILGDGYFHQRQCECIVNVKDNMDYYSENVKQDCDRCLRYCPQGKIHWEKGGAE